MAASARSASIRRVAVVAGACALAGGAASLTGWVLGVRWLLDWGGHGITIKANTAACLMAAGAAMVVAVLAPASRRIVQGLGAFIGVVGLLTIIEHITRADLRIDQLLFTEPSGAPATAAPGRMGPPASISFVLLGAALFALTRGAHARRWAGRAGIAVTCIAMLPLVGYVYGASELFGISRITGIAWQTAMMLAALGVATIAAVPEHGLAAAMRRDDAGGVVMRRLFVPVLVGPLLLGWLRVQGQRMGLYDVAFGTAARSVVEVLLLGGVLWWTARGISRQARAARRATETLRESEGLLREADRRKDEFLALLAHELRNPLAPLRNGLEIARRGRRDPAAVERAHAVMERQLAQMVHLVDDLLDVSRLSRGKVELRKEPLSIASAVESAIETCRPVIEGFGHELDVSWPPEPMFVDGDLTRLAQVFSNLINNAAKYTDPGGVIRVSITREDGEVVVRVRDNGMGVPADRLPQIFDMFTQVDGSLARSRGGLGIGLTLVRRLVELHGGRVTALSPPAGQERGTELTVRLPLGAVPAHATEAVANPAGARTAPRLRVLVADDNEDAAESLAILLEELGHEIRTAHDGAEALEVASDFHPDVAVLDIGMPKLDGYEVARRIRAEAWGNHLVLVALTGWGQAEDRRRSSDAGFDHHLVKPLPYERLEEVLASTRPA